MAPKRGLYPPIYRIDTGAVREFFNADQVQTVDLPKMIIDAYNRSKEGLLFKLEGSTDYDDCRIDIYRNVTVHPVSNPWRPFYQTAGLAIPDVKSQNQQFIGFVVLDEEVIVHTGGHSAQVFERFVDLSFPINVARRIAQPEIKRARSSPIAGAALAADVNFRDPRRLTHTESLENVWTALSGQLRPELLNSLEIRSIFGANKKKMKLDVAGSLRFGPRVETLDKLLALIRWLLVVADSPPPQDDEWKILDSIKLLNPRKSRDTLDRLKSSLASKLIVERDYRDFALTHTDATAYASATKYDVFRGTQKIYSGEDRPEIPDALNGVSPGPEGPKELLHSIVLTSKSADSGPSAETYGTLLDHLHGEMSYDGRTYFLLAGRWYQVDADYVTLVTEDFARLIEELDLSSATLDLSDWQEEESEGAYNDRSATETAAINGDRVLTNNVELFDLLISREGRTYIVHVKRGYDVKIRDVRSQIVNSAKHHRK